MAQVAVVNNRLLDNLKVEKFKSVYTAANCIYGCEITPDYKLLLVNYTGRSLIGIDSEGKHLFTISTAPYFPFDVTCIDDTTVAVTASRDKIISIIDISSKTVKKHINVGYSCHGVTYREGTLLLCADCHGILSINLRTGEVTTTVRCDLGFFSYITSYKDKMYYTDDKTKIITCCDMKGNRKWTFKDEGVLCHPQGITTDNEGRVYVCDTARDTVIVLSHDGQQSKKIISKEDELILPYSIHFDKKRNNLLVATTVKKVCLCRVSF